MGIRVIITCDNNLPVREPCHTQRNIKALVPFGFGLSVITAHDAAIKDAFSLGWKKLDGRWICPYCQPIVVNLDKRNGKP